MVEATDKAIGELTISRLSQRIRSLAHDHPLNDWEYLIHHIEVINGAEELHHCMLYDHLGNMFEQVHLVIKNGRVTVGGKAVQDGVFHVIIGLEPTQDVAWSDVHAQERKIKPKSMSAGMTFVQKSREW